MIVKIHSKMSCSDGDLSPDASNWRVLSSEWPTQKMSYWDLRHEETIQNDAQIEFPATKTTFLITKAD